MQAYRLRANHLQEAMELKLLLQNTEIMFRRYHDVPDVEVRFNSLLSLTDLAILIASIDDSDTMIETLAYEDEYTGNRDYGIRGLIQWNLLE